MNKANGYTSFTTLQNYFQKVPEISIKTMQWNHFISEPIIFYELMAVLMKGLKFKRENVDESFKSYYSPEQELGNDEQELSFMHNIFIYKKK